MCLSSVEGSRPDISILYFTASGGIPTFNIFKKGWISWDGAWLDAKKVLIDGKNVKVNVVFQIWSKLHKSQESKPVLNGAIKIYSLSDGGTPGSTRNKKHLNTCNYYLPSTCFGKDKMKIYYDFEKLPQRRGYGIVVLSNKDHINSIIEKTNWSDVSFASTNGAYNLRFDLIEKNIWNQMKYM